ncbi:hypothetical protein Q9966_001262 [Columba livia]|nr:hypothetical protein Q9966_001262 [Columba livia]
MFVMSVRRPLSHQMRCMPLLNGLCFEAGGLSFHSVFLISVPSVVCMDNVLHTLSSENVLLYFAAVYLMPRPTGTFTSPPSPPIQNPEAVTKV